MSWYVGLAWILRLVEDTGVWPDGLLDAYVTMIPKSDGDSTPLGQRPLCVLPVIYRLWASVRLGHIQHWFYSWVTNTVFSAGKGVSSVDAWYATSLDIEEVLSGAVDGHVHLFVADVIKSFDTVDRGILDRALGRLGLPDWFRKVYFSFHANVRLRFKLATGLGEAWTRDGGIPQGCPLSMVSIVALHVPWCRYLSSQHGVTPQLYADNLKCTTTDGRKLLEAARFSDQYIRAVGQEASAGKCVLLSTSKATRERMKNWSISAGDKGWGFKLDVRDLGGHLDITNRARAGTLAQRTVRATSQVHLVGALPFVFLRSIGIVRSKFLPAGLHGAEGSHISGKNLSSFRTGIVKACWPNRLPMANPHAVLSLLDAPDCSDPELYVIWCRFRQMRRFLANRPDEVPRVYRMLDFAAAGRPGHGPVHLLIQSASLIGLAWDSNQEGWIRPGLPPLRMLSGPYQHFKSSIFEAWREHAAAVLTSRKGFRCGPFLDYHGTMQLLFSSHLRERDKMLLRSILCGGAWNGFLLGKTKEEEVPCRFCGRVDGDGHLFWDCPSPSLVLVREHPEFLPLMKLDRSTWPRCLAWHGWLPSLACRRVQPPWAVAKVDSVDAALETALGVYPIRPGSELNPAWEPDDIVDLADNVPNHPNIWTDGSRDEDLDAMVGVAGAGAFVKDVPWVFDGPGDTLKTLTLEMMLLNFSMVPGSLQTVQRAEYWGCHSCLAGPHASSHWH